MALHQRLLTEDEQPDPTRGQQPPHDAVAGPQWKRRKCVSQMDQHQDQEPPADGGEPDADAQGHPRAYGGPQFTSEFVCRQRHFPPQQRLGILYEASQQLRYRRFSGRHARVHD
jgi:hypothetical protein